MDPTTLIGPASPMGFPAPYWFLVLFKVLGFVLHLVPMNLWFAGIILALLLRWRGGEHGRRWSARLMQQMPIVVALGVNLGIVPLLFTQVAYYRVFYPSTILMAWPWFAVILLLTVSYYGVYVYAVGLHTGRTLTRARQAAGWAAAALFVVIGFLFANSFSLMVNLAAWPGLWQSTNVGGAPLGTALNVGDVSLWPRWLLMFGLALTTTAAYAVVDAAFMANRERPEYRQWAGAFALKVYTVGLIWVAVAGLWYVFGTWTPELRQSVLSAPMVVLTVLTAAGPGLPWLMILAQRRGVARPLALAVGLSQFAVLGLHAISRQIQQNLELGRFLDVTAEKANTQWTPLLVFLLLFVGGLVVILWMVSKVVAVERGRTATSR